jgi:hypothetical protein
MFHHFGGFAGFAAHVSYIPEASVGVAVFSNDSGQSVIHGVANYAYDRALGHADAGARLDAALDAAAAQRARAIRSMEQDRANRAGRPWTLTRPRTAYSGASENEAWGRIEVSAAGEALTVRFGALRGEAEPFTQPNSIRVELVPGQGEPILFTGDGDQPEALRTRMATFRRV